MGTGVVLGPVLSFRGCQAGQWRVTALLGVEGAVTPRLTLAGQLGVAPQALAVVGKRRYLRYDLSQPLGATERRVTYALEGVGAWDFSLPSQAEAPRMAYVSCNGFSDANAIRKLVRPANAVWEDFLCNHDPRMRPPSYRLDKEQLWHEARLVSGVQRFHLLMMGGDQLYLDTIWEDIPELRAWVGLSRAEQLAYKVSKALEAKIERYYLDLYPARWLAQNRPAWDKGMVRDAADALARVPTLMMWDDHDIFDGWGSYTAQMQSCAVFQTLFQQARRAFWLFQMQHVLADLPPLAWASGAGLASQDPLYAPMDWAAYRRRDALALPLLDQQPGFSSVYAVGGVAIVAADLRTERSRTQILGPYTWAALQGYLGGLKNVSHLLFMASVPVIHPKLTLAEGLMDLVGQDHVQDSAADDVRDHWSHDEHEGERLRLVDTLTRTALRLKLRVTLVSGDVHVAACGSVWRSDLPEATRMQQLTASAVVHPSLVGLAERLFASVLEQAAANPQPLDTRYQARMQRFPSYNRAILAARNWLALEWEGAGQTPMWASWRAEAESGFSNHIVVVQPAPQ